MLHTRCVAALLLVLTPSAGLSAACPRPYCIYVPNVIQADVPSAPPVTSTPMLTPSVTPVPTPTSAPPNSIAWSTVNPAPIKRHEAQGVAVDGKLYVFGGYVDSWISVKSASVYDTVARSWAPIKDIPQGTSHAGIAADGHAIYLAGGYIPRPGGGQVFATEKVWKYSVDTDSWSAMPSLPQARGAGAMVRLGRELHFFGGTNVNRIDQTTHWIFKLDGGTQWTTARPMLTPRNHMGAVALGGKIYAVGGDKGVDVNSVTQALVEVYDPASDQWTRVESLPGPRGHIAAATFLHNGRIIVAGGEWKYKNPVSAVTAYDPATRQWTELTALPTARSSGVGASIGGALWYSGGSFSTTTFKGVTAAPSTDALGTSLVVSALRLTLLVCRPIFLAQVLGGSRRL